MSYSDLTPVTLTISGTDAADLAARCRTVLASLDDPANATAGLADLSARLSVVTPDWQRLALVVADRTELRQALAEVLATLPRLADDPTGRGRWYAGSVADVAPTVGLLYPGQGAQRVGEHAALAGLSPAFADRCLELLDAACVDGLEPLLTSGWQGHPVRPDATAEQIRLTDASQTLLSVLGVAVTEFLAAIGVRPDLVVGHSVGEFPALHSAGFLSATDAVALASRRGQIMRAQLGEGDFGMVALRCSVEEASALAAAVADVYPSCCNSARQTVYGGTRQALEAFVDECRRGGVVATLLPTQGAFHTPFMAASGAQFDPVLADVAWSGQEARFISTVSGAEESDSSRIGQLLSEQITAPVAFRQAGTRLMDAAPDVLVQVSGGDSLISMLRADHPAAPFVGIGLGGAQDNAAALATSLAQLFVRLPGAHLGAALAGTGVAARWRLQDVRLDRSSVFKLSAALPTWASDDLGARTRLEGVLDGQGTAAGSAEPALAQVGGARAATGPAVAEIREAVLAAMSRASGSPVDELARGGRLAEDLGFDSLLMADTLRRLAAEFPDLVPAELPLADAVDVDGLVGMLASALGADTGPREEPVHAAETPAVLPETCQTRLDELPELVAFEAKQESFRSSGTLVPYYLPHEGTISAHTRIGGREFISFSSYNYLGLSEHPQVQRAVVDAVRQYGTSASAARILSGNRPLHDDLERAIADFIGAEDAVVMVGGHATNASIVPLLVGDQDIIFHDGLVHDSVQQGVKASGATRHSFPHNDLDALDAALRRRRGNHRRALVCVEGAYSMDGDTAPLAGLVELKERHGAILMVDEAHSFGTVGATGRGICEASGVDPARVDVLMGTLSKAMASCGGYLAGSRRFCDYLRYNLSSLVFSAALSPANTAAALASLRVLAAEPQRVRRLQENADRFRDGVDRLGLDWGTGVGTPIVPVIYGDSARTLSVANDLYRRGISINPILAPAVAERLARLRVFITAQHTSEDLDAALCALAELSERNRTLAHVG